MENNNYWAELYDFLYHDSDIENINLKILFHESTNDVNRRDRWVEHELSLPTKELLQKLPDFLMGIDTNNIFENEIRRRKNVILSYQREYKLKKLNSI